MYRRNWLAQIHNNKDRESNSSTVCLNIKTIYYTHKSKKALLGIFEDTKI